MKDLTDFIQSSLPGFSFKSVEELKNASKEEVHDYVESLGKIQSFCSKRKIQLESELERNKKDKDDIMNVLCHKYGVLSEEEIDGKIEQAEVQMGVAIEGLQKILA